MSDACKLAILKEVTLAPPAKIKSQYQFSSLAINSYRDILVHKSELAPNRLSVATLGEEHVSRMPEVLITFK